MYIIHRNNTKTNITTNNERHVLELHSYMWTYRQLNRKLAATVVSESVCTMLPYP